MLKLYKASGMRLLDLFVTLATWKYYRRKLKKNLPPKKNLKSSFSLPLFGEAGGKGDSVFALPPAEPVNEIGSDIFKYIPLLIFKFKFYQPIVNVRTFIAKKTIF